MVTTVGRRADSQDRDALQLPAVGADAVTMADGITIGGQAITATNVSALLFSLAGPGWFLAAPSDLLALALVPPLSAIYLAVVALGEDRRKGREPSWFAVLALIIAGTEIVVFAPLIALEPLLGPG